MVNEDCSVKVGRILLHFYRNQKSFAFTCILLTEQDSEACQFHFLSEKENNI